jgi:hypothetical protein
MICFRQPASAYPASFSHADGAVTNKKRDSFDDIETVYLTSDFPHKP